MAAETLPMDQQETSALSTAVSDGYTEAEAEFDKMFDDISGQLADEEKGGKGEQAGDAEQAEPDAAAPLKEDPKPPAGKKPVPAAEPEEETPAAEELPQAAHAAVQPTPDQARESYRRQIIQGQQALDRMKRQFESAYGTSLYPPELLERERRLRELQAEVEADVPKVTQAYDARYARAEALDQRVQDAILYMQQNIDRVTQAQAVQMQETIVRLAHPDVNLKDPRWRAAVETWAQTLPYGEAIDILDPQNGIMYKGDAGEVVELLNRFKAAIGGQESAAETKAATAAASPAVAARKGRMAAAMAVPTKRTSAPKTSGKSGADPDDFESGWNDAVASLTQH